MPFFILIIKGGGYNICTDLDKVTIGLSILTPKINQQGVNMSIIKYEQVHVGDFSSFIENLVSKTKSKKFRAGFI